MVAIAKRYSDVRFKASDLEVLQLTISELTLMHRMEEYEREQNRAKAREIRGHIERIREKKTEVIADS